MKRFLKQLTGAGLVFAATCAAQADDQLIRKGSRLFANNCATCHGEDLQNNSTIAFDLRRLRADEHERFVTSVTNGKNVMPSWDGVLDNADKEALWAYIRDNAYEK